MFCRYGWDDPYEYDEAAAFEYEGWYQDPETGRVVDGIFKTEKLTKEAQRKERSVNLCQIISGFRIYLLAKDNKK